MITFKRLSDARVVSLTIKESGFHVHSTSCTRFINSLKSEVLWRFVEAHISLEIS